ncbi:MAG: dehydrogenase [Gammaproteobacteria bacterium]|nr:MAG: dehydrogenase [Gammaproteobacteria bacterium]
MRWDTVASLSRRSFLLGSAALGVSAAFKLNPIARAMAEAGVVREPGSGKWVATTCAGCTSFCAKQIYVQDGRALSIRGNEFSKVHGKAGCVRQFLSLTELYDPDRIKTPLKRTNPKKGRSEDPKFKPISWDEAMGILADRVISLRESGEIHKYVTLRGRYSYLSSVTLKDITAVFGSPNAITHSAICAEAEKFGSFFTEGSWGYRQFDIANTRYALLFGVDPLSANRQVSYYSSEWGNMLDRGSVAVVDPRFSATAAKADEWIPIVPGQDAALALALAHTLLVEGLWYRPFVGDFNDGENLFKAGEEVDESSFTENHTHGLVKWWNLELRERTPEWAEAICGVSSEQIRRVARKLGDAAPKVQVWRSRGVEMQTRGAYMAMAGHALNGLLGSIDNAGGVLSFNKVPLNKTPKPKPYLDAIAKAGLAHERIDRRGRLEFPALKKGKSGGGVVTNATADSILESDPYDVQVILGCFNNFTFSAPEPQRWEEALKKVPLVAHITTNISEFTWYADLVLPAPHSMYERYGVNKVGGNGYGQASIQQPMIKPLGDYVQDETGVGWLLAQALESRGFDAPMRYLKESYKDPETGKQPTNPDELGLYALKILTQKLWDPAKYKNGDRFDGWDHFQRVGVWNSDPYHYRSHWSKMKTATKKFEFYSKTLVKALEKHAGKHNVTTDQVMEACKYEARGELVFVPHYETPKRYGDEDKFPFLFIDHKSRLTREGRGSNTPWFQANKDIDPGEVKYKDVAKLNPKDASKLGITNGDRIKLTTTTGSITCEAALWEGVQPGTVAKAFGQGHWAYGRKSSVVFGKHPRGGNNNLLLPAEFERLSGSSAFYGQIGVRVEKV